MSKENVHSAKEAGLDARQSQVYNHCSQYYCCQIASVNVMVQFCPSIRDKSTFNTAQSNQLSILLIFCLRYPFQCHYQLITSTKSVSKL